MNILFGMLEASEPLNFTAKFCISSGEAFRRGDNNDYALGFMKERELLLFWDYGASAWELIPYPFQDHQS